MEANDRHIKCEILKRTAPLSAHAHASGALEAPISVFDAHRLVVIPSTLSLDESREIADRFESSLLLVQDSPDTIEGVLSREVLDDVAEWNEPMRRSLSVSQMIERNFAIEPDSVSMGELLERLTEGDARYVVIVDRLGRPLQAISLNLLYGAIEAQAALLAA